MNKTVTINISGIIFHIEEDAYEKLGKYLATIKGYFASSESGNEIISDIEARIAELLQSKINAGKQVVLMVDVNDVITALGTPEEFGINEEPEKEKNSPVEKNEPIKKRIFRDPDEKAIGGVCSGIAHYLNIDVVWVRLFTFLLIFFGGISLWVYIILWIIIPEAKTTTDRLAMRGEKINIDSISKSFKDEMSGVKSRVEKYGNDLSDGVNKAAKNSGNVADRLAYLLGRFFMLLGRFIGLFFIFISLMLLIGLISMIFGFTFSGNNAEYNNWINMIFDGNGMYRLGLAGLFISIGVPAFMLLYGGIKLLFKIKYHNKWLNITAVILWFIGLFTLITVGVKTGADFSESAKTREIAQFTTALNTLTISAVSNQDWLNKNNIDKAPMEEDLVDSKWSNQFFFAGAGNKTLLLGTPELKIMKARGPEFEVVINKKSRGSTKEFATERAGEISYSVKADSSGILLDPLFFIPPTEKFRAQQVEILVKVPENKIVFLDKSLAKIIDEADNVNDAYEHEMLGRSWKMTDIGLACVDCNGLGSGKHKKKQKSKQIIINEDGVKIKRKNTKITIDEDGVEIKENEKDED